MTNEEKAMEIFSDNKYECKTHGYEQDTNEILFMIEKMGLWKDEQFAAEKQALIDKACLWLENIIFDKVDALFYDDNDIEFVKTVSGKEFADLFRKAMEE